jgi:predicted kinase
VVVSGPAGSGKTTLAHALAREIRCPAICRDEIKEGMVHPFGADFQAAPGDELTRRTFPLFFAILRLLIEAETSVVAEAAFQDKLWRPNLEPLIELGAKIRIVQCHTDPDTARHRLDGRGARSAHADDTAKGDEYYASFQRVELVVASLDVDTTAGYQPSLDEVVRFVNA